MWKVEVTNKQTGEPTGLKPEQMDERIHDLNVVDASDEDAYVALVFGDIEDGSVAIKRANILAAAQDMLAALERLATAAECRDNTSGDPARLIVVRAELAAAAAFGRAAIAKARGE